MVFVDVKNSMVQQLSRMYVDDLFKKKFRKWKFDVQWTVDCAQVNNATIDAPADDVEEE
ncbi:cytochrome P450 CYP736A12-like [Pyrus ussuriensis x Pyrus communis]|uniref:Cytochrome P450 CYP736A12-like n=1 Tax=Pyrus ussuriensis x Pyrus communis TaxID=2448454 RepID=A0A5N5FSX3_9ROSA|nr:cytochrome P450 CYP736A12-like [Pyrus ussuriensis x Pyrus communis]